MYASKANTLTVDVSLFTVLCDVEASRLVSTFGPERDRQADQFQQHEARRSAVHDRCHDRDGLDAKLARISEKQAVRDAVERLLCENTR